MSGPTADVTVSITSGTLLYVRVADLVTFAEWVGEPGEVAAIVDGLGDAAYSGTAGADEPTVYAFRSGSRAVRLMSEGKNPDGSRVVTAGQLRQIAELMASRME